MWAFTIANHGRSRVQPEVPASLAHRSQMVRRRLAREWKAPIEVNDDNRKRVSKLIEARSTNESHSRDNAVQLFPLRNKHTLLRESMAKQRWVIPFKCLLCHEDSLSTSHVLFHFPALAWAREVDWGDTSLEMALWGSKRITEQTVRLIKMFLRTASK